jgi:hypothetical protein
MLNKSIILIVFLISCLRIISAEIVSPEVLPSKRIIDNLNKSISKNPKDENLYYLLGRVHYLTFIYKIENILVYNHNEDKPIIFPEYNLENLLRFSRRVKAESIALKEFGVDSRNELTDEILYNFITRKAKIVNFLTESNWEPEKISNEDILYNIENACLNFEKAIQLQPNNALYNLTIASLCYQAIAFKDKQNYKDIPKLFHHITIEKAFFHFCEAFKLTIDNDLKLKELPNDGVYELISYEAGLKILEISKNRQALKKDNKKFIKLVFKSMKKLNKIPKKDDRITVISPIIFTFQNQNGLDDLLDKSKSVLFDLNGNNKKEMWPWVKNTTGFLVWDPLSSGKITSGRQMFGSVTWWLFFENGYEALSLLDNNFDGILKDEELLGIKVWFDKNENGVSELNEVVSLEMLGIIGIGTKATEFKSDHIINQEGIFLNNEKKIVSYDWFPKSIAPVHSK